MAGSFANDISPAAAAQHGSPVVSTQSLTAIRSLPKAWELLAQQPISLAGMTQDERRAVVVTAVVDDQGREHVLSRLGDRVWDLSPLFVSTNRHAAEKKIYWPDDVPQELIDDAKAALYCALRQGRGQQNFSASTVHKVGRSCSATLKYLASLGVTNFSQARTLYVTDHIATLEKSISPVTISHRLYILDLVWAFHDDVLHPLPEHPFAGKTLWGSVGSREGQSDPAGRTGRTPVIPPSVQSRLWAYCEATLAGAEAVFQARDAGKIEASSDKLVEIRDAVLYVLQITSGMRNSESVGVTNGCWREEERTVAPGRAVAFHWVRTREIKTTGGKEVDFLVPPEAFSALAILQRYAEPLQQRLADEARWLEDVIASGTGPDGLLTTGLRVADAVQRLNYARSIEKHMVLTISHTASDHWGVGSRVEVLSRNACISALRRLVKAAGIDWKIANHQCRRTFAYNVANSRLGRMGLVFIKWQFKHASLSWTQLYAANPRQDQALYEEFTRELLEGKVEVLEAWNQADARLSGGAGKKLMQTRATPVKDFKELLVSTAQAVTLRSTGHAWCMSGTRGCHGQGIYDPTLCGGGCSQAVIDDSQGPRWQMIHLDNLRLASITDCGPAVELKSKRSIEVSSQVLTDLGVSLPTAEQARAYEAGLWVV